MNNKKKLMSQGARLSGATALAVGFTLAASTQAAVIIPEKSGISGYVNLGAGGLSVKSNMLASIISGKVDLGDKTVDSLNDSPDNSKGGAIPSVNLLARPAWWAPATAAPASPQMCGRTPT